VTLLAAPADLDLSVVVVSFNTRDHLRACLASLRAEGSTNLSRTDAPLEAEVIVVDNASTDGSADMVAAEFPAAVLIRAPRNGGFAYANNLALRRARGRAILLLNPDAEASPGSLAALLAALQARPEAGVVGPKLLRADGSMHLACRRSFPSPTVSLYRLAGLSRLAPRSPRFGRYNLTYLDPDLETPVDAVTGACMLVRRAALETVGPLDERFFMYGEDLDWCWRFHAAGWTVRYVPSVTIRHRHGAASRQRPLRTTVHFFRAMDLFYRKHYAARYNPAVNAAVLFAIYAGLAAAVLRLLATPPARRRVSV
jgi:GT2 family glycosyltransferase